MKKTKKKTATKKDGPARKAAFVEIPKGTKGGFAVPAGTKTIAATAFRGASGVRTISIPASVERIELCLATPECAMPWFPFLGCSRLEEIRVSPRNRRFASRDGALYTKDFSVLLRAAGTKRRSFVLPRRTKAVAATAFDDCPALASFEVEDGSESFVARDGLLLTKDGMSLVRVPPAYRKPVRFAEYHGGVFLGAFRSCRRLAELSFEFLPSVRILSADPDDRSGADHPAFEDLLLDELMLECAALPSVSLPTGAFDLARGEPSRLRNLRRLGTPKAILDAAAARWDRIRRLREKAAERRLAAVLGRPTEMVSAEEFFKGAERASSNRRPNHGKKKTERRN